MELNVTAPEMDALPPIVSVSKSTGDQLAEAAQNNGTVSLWLPYYSSFDFNVLLLWILAVGTFIAAGLWAGHDSVGAEHDYQKANGDQEVQTCPCF